jgi:hypothetical protein
MSWKRLPRIMVRGDRPCVHAAEIGEDAADVVLLALQ